METQKIIWNKYPDELTNFECIITNTGKWEENVYGKWLCLFKPLEKLNKFGKIITAPTYSDILNLISATLEVERRNDLFGYAYNENSFRPFEKHKKLKIIKDLLLDIENKWSK